MSLNLILRASNGWGIRLKNLILVLSQNTNGRVRIDDQQAPIKSGRREWRPRGRIAVPFKVVVECSTLH